MKRIILSTILLVSLSWITNAQTTEFTYQGNLNVSSSPATGNYDFEFALFDALTSGTQVGSTVTRPSVAVSAGAFSVKIDFGAQFPGADRYLEIRVRQSGGGAFVPLTPRQHINSAPYSIKSTNADNAANATNAESATTAATATNAHQLGGVAANQYVLTGDSRLTDARNPLPGSGDYIQNQTSGTQSSSNFNISGTGKASVFDASTQFSIGGTRILSIAGTRNLFAGQGAGAANTTGTDNSYFGWNAGALANVTFSTFFGSRAGEKHMTGCCNSFFGAQAGVNNVNGVSNSFFGYQAGRDNAGGSGNSFFGQVAGALNTSGGENSFFGNGAGTNNSVGNRNAFFGYLAGITNTTGVSNSAFGYAAGFLTNNLTNATAIGANARVDQNNSLVLGSINGIGGATADTAVVIGNTTNTFIGTPARFTVVQNTSGQWTQHIGTNGSAPGASFGLLIDAGTSTTDSPFRIRSQAAALDLFLIRGDGNVGIGHAEPNSHLHLKANAPQGFAIQMENTSTAKRLYIGNYGTTGGGNHWPGRDSANTSFLYAENPLVFTTPGGIYFSGSTTAEHMRIAPNGGIVVSTDQSFTVRNATTGAERFTVTASGSTLNPGFFRVLDFISVANLGTNGDVSLCWQTASGVLARCSSSLRYKTNIDDLTSGLELIKLLRPISFSWKSTGKTDLGLAAEEVEGIEPLLVSYGKDGQVEGVKYDRIGVVLINAVKEQQAQIESQRQSIDSLREQVDELKSVLCELKPALAVCARKEN